MSEPIEATHDKILTMLAWGVGPEEILALAEKAVTEALRETLLDTFRTDHRYVHLAHEMKQEMHDIITERVKAKFSRLKEVLK